MGWAFIFNTGAALLMGVVMILLRHIDGHDKFAFQGMATEDTVNQRTVVLADIFAVERSDREMEEIVSWLSIEPDVKAVSWKWAA
jgi:hypothetical protein